MIRKITLFFFGIIMLSATGSTQTEKNSLLRGVNHDAKIYDDTLFVACENGIYSIDLKRVNARWEPYAFIGMDIWEFAKYNHKLIAVQQTSDGDNGSGTKSHQRLLQSADEGKTYSDITPTNTADNSGGYTRSRIRLWQMPETRKHVLALAPLTAWDNSLGPTGVLHESLDFGQTWAVKPSAMPSAAKLAISTNSPEHVLGFGRIPDVDCTCPFVVVTNDGFLTLESLSYKVYVENGTVEMNHTGEILFNDICFNPTKQNTIIAATSMGLMKSLDGGNNWHVTLSEKENEFYYKHYHGIIYEAQNPQLAYAYRYQDSPQGMYKMELYRSQNAGDSWDKVYTTDACSVPLTVILQYGSSLIFIGYRDYIYFIDVSTLQTNIGTLEKAEGNIVLSSDLQGRRLTTLPTKGLYIHNGKKIIR